MSYDNILVVEVRTPNFALVLAACSKHASGWGVIWTSYYLANEAELPRSNHFLDAWNVVKHLKHFVVSYSSLLYIAYREVEYVEYFDVEIL